MSHLVIDRLDFRLRLLERRSRIQAADNEISARITNAELLVGERERLPNFGAFSKLTARAEIEKLKGKIEARRHDSDDGEISTIEQKLRAQYVRIAVEFATPQ